LAPQERCAHFPDDLVKRCGAVDRVLEVGVGAGFDAVRFCARGRNYLGIDISAAAVAVATDRLHEFGMAAPVQNVDFLALETPDRFQLIFDRGVFHNQRSDAARETFVAQCASLLVGGGHWISVIGSADSQTASPHGSLYLSNVVSVVERYFEVLAVDLRPYGPDDWPDNFDAWHCLFKKRTAP
jgi:SAM-dependent methyltransferase